MIEEALQKSIFTGQNERTFISKLFAEKDVQDIRELMKKEKLTRSELLELLYLISANEGKLVNYSGYDRYIILKFFVWIREFIKIAEVSFDYSDDLKKRLQTCVTCKRIITDDTTIKDKCTCETPRRYFISDRTKQLIFNNERSIEHIAKFLIDLYLNIARTTLSLGATGFIETLKNKYEIAYPNMTTGQGEGNKNSFFSFLNPNRR